MTSGRRFSATGMAGSSISFGFTLPSDPTAHFIPAAGPADPSCPGSSTHPEAAPGQLCVYEGVATGNAAGSIIVVSKYGAIIRATSNAAGIFGTTGTWAVTAT